MLTSVNDLLLLSQGILQTIDALTDAPLKSVQKLKAVCNRGVALDNDEMVDVWFKPTALPPTAMRPPTEDEIPELTLPIFDAASFAIRSDQENRVLLPVIRFLRQLPPRPNYPGTLLEFVAFQLQRAKDNGDEELLARTQTIQDKIARAGKSEPQLLELVSLVLKKRVVENADRLALAFHIQQSLENLKKMEKDTTALGKELEPIIHLSLTRAFLAGDAKFKELEAAKQGLLKDPNAWQAFLLTAQKELMTFAERFKIDAATGRKLIRQLHARFTEKLTFNQFLDANGKQAMMNKDQAIVNKYPAIMEAFMKDSYSKPLQRIFATPGCFQSALAILQIGTSIGTPLERLTKIGDCIDVLQDIYLFEANEGCPGDDFLPLFLFALLSAKLTNLASMAGYLRLFVIGVEDQIKILDSREKYVATTFISAVDHIIGQV
jgi:hypothetical protein